ncbi:invasion associated locus B family protein [Chelatococcus sambhunathii]|uniref:invasion associated locus B family protein n=1 Tax=Chelatococcus sambhunathii TaxID=363953 RepID=UPI002852502F|nr:invasion associated locus B family protein [Chelatococcus sambhunathii]
MDLGKFARLAAMTTAIALTAGQAVAQDAQKPAAPAPAPQAQGAGGPGPMPMNPPAAPQPEWVKICNTDDKAKKEVCLTSRDVRTETGQNVASIAVRQVSGEPKKFFLAAVPPGLLIQPGIRVAVDNNQPATGKYSICFPNACYAEVEITDAFFKNMQKGKNLVVQAMNQQAKTINFPVGLDGFQKAYDGAALDAKQVADQQEKNNEAMQRKAQELRDKMQPSGAQAPADSAAPAPGGKAQVKGAQ